MNQEIYHEGWLTKSPPTKRIWRARWRKRWFTLKQGEIPGQFCLEYYTDRNCRKLKGVIDLDQCEQVDSGLRLEHRKQKFQYMFDIKTPRRTYYLAADTENDMRDWVNCICQVCNLHDFTKQPNERQYYNISDNSTSALMISTSNSNAEAPLQEQQQEQHNKMHDITNDNIMSSSNNAMTTLNNSNLIHDTNCSTRQTNSSITSTSNLSEITNRTEQLQLTNNAYQNNDFSYVNTDYSSREVVISDSDLQNDKQMPFKQTLKQFEAKYNENIILQGISNELPSTSTLSTLIDRSQSFRDISTTQENETLKDLNRTMAPLIPNHTRAHSLNETGTNKRTLISSTGVVKKIPENLVLSNTFVESSVEPSPALSTSSGPYIPISECFSGSPKILNNDVPSTPLNSLDPKFYDTPRSHNNIGLNLTNDQSYSPKIYNCPQNQVKQRSGRSTPSDSESVFTDDDEWSHSMPLRENADRNLRPSDSSVENDSVVFTYTQRFSKIPHNSKTPEIDKLSEEITEKTPRRRNRLVLKSNSDEEKLPDLPQLSDTDNASPAIIIGPRDASSSVEESYDIPRSHQFPYYNISSIHQLSPDNTALVSSTPDLIAETEKVNSKTLSRKHYYTNAAPIKIEGNVFRYDFVEQSDLPPVNRNLKPKLNNENKISTDSLIKQKPSVPTHCSTPIEKSPPKPPSVDRKLKPSTVKDSPIGPSTLRRPGIPASFIASDSEFNVNHKELETRTLPRNVSSATNSSYFSKLPIVQGSHPTGISGISGGNSILELPKPNNSALQYFDLDTANPPPPPPQINRTVLNSFSRSSFGSSGSFSKLGSVSLESGGGSIRSPVKSGVVYNSVDFLKTEAFKRIREDAEKSRMKD